MPKLREKEVLQTVLPNPFRQISYLSLGQFLNFTERLKIEIVEIVEIVC